MATDADAGPDPAALTRDRYPITGAGGRGGTTPDRRDEMTTQERKAKIAAAGGLAFPRPGDEFNGAGGQEDGMALRDWFAGKAIAGMLAAVGTTVIPEVYAKAAYQVADAMLAARVSQPKPE